MKIKTFIQMLVLHLDIILQNMKKSLERCLPILKSKTCILFIFFI